ncbi:hypothetical protein P8452_58760 [Trifolium repens]|nr:hypothetical protein P8452_58760 [Trifolium repens]
MTNSLLLLWIQQLVDIALISSNNIALTLLFNQPINKWRNSFRSAELRLSEDPGLFHTMLSTSQKVVSQSAALCTTSHSKDNCCVPAICTITPLQRGQLRSYP